MTRLCLVALLAVSLAACVPPFSAKNESDVLLRITNITGESGHNGEVGETLFSDVMPVFNDNAQLTIQAILKNPNVGTVGEFNDVQLTNYTVKYVRSDGRAIEGIDVPFAISGNMNLMIPADGEGEAVIVVVRHQAKNEAPLKNLILGGLDEFGGSGFLTVSAEITIYGRTTSGKTVSATGFLEITFTDFANA